MIPPKRGDRQEIGTSRVLSGPGFHTFEFVQESLRSVGGVVGIPKPVEELVEGVEGLGVSADGAVQEGGVTFGRFLSEQISIVVTNLRTVAFQRQEKRRNGVVRLSDCLASILKTHLLLMIKTFSI